MEYGDLFSDDRQMADIDPDQWLTVPLVSDWAMSGAKLGHCIYPVGPKDREIIDQTHEKLH